MNKLELIYNINEARKNICSIRDIDQEIRELEQKTNINLKRRTFSIKISKALSITTEKVKFLIDDKTGNIFDDIADQIVLKVADSINQSNKKSKYCKNTHRWNVSSHAYTPFISGVHV